MLLGLAPLPWLPLPGPAPPLWPRYRRPSPPRPPPSRTAGTHRGRPSDGPPALAPCRLRGLPALGRRGRGPPRGPPLPRRLWGCPPEVPCPLPPWGRGAGRSPRWGRVGTRWAPGGWAGRPVACSSPGSPRTRGRRRSPRSAQETCSLQVFLHGGGARATWWNSGGRSARRTRGGACGGRSSSSPISRPCAAS